MTQPYFLIIDDDETFASTLARALRKHGHETGVAHSGDEALSHVQARLESNSSEDTHIILDMKLGSDSGLQVLPRLLALRPKAKVVVLTGYSSIANAVEAIKLGATNYLCKPASSKEILSAFCLADEISEPKQADSQLDKSLSLQRLEWEHIQRTLADYNGNVSATARHLGMHRRTLQRKLLKRPVKN